MLTALFYVDFVCFEVVGVVPSLVLLLNSYLGLFVLAVFSYFEVCLLMF